MSGYAPSVVILSEPEATEEPALSAAEGISPSAGSQGVHGEILRFAQDDKTETGDPDITKLNRY